MVLKEAPTVWGWDPLSTVMCHHTGKEFQHLLPHRRSWEDKGLLRAKHVLSKCQSWASFPQPQLSGCQRSPEEELCQQAEPSCHCSRLWFANSLQNPWNMAPVPYIRVTWYYCPISYLDAKAASCINETSVLKYFLGNSDMCQSWKVKVSKLQVL